MGFEKKKPVVGVYGLAMVLISYGITINAVGIGASVGQGLNLSHGIAATIIGIIILCVLATASGLMGSKTQYSTDVVWRYIYGFMGGRIPSIIVGVSIMLWTFFDMWYVGAALKGIFKAHPNIAFIIGEAIVLCFCIYGGRNGIKALEKIAKPTIPIAIVLFAILLVQEVRMGGGFETLAQYQPLPAEVIPFATGINIVVGHFICCTGLWGDLTCEASSRKAVFVAIPAGMLANMFIGFVGQLGVIGLHVYGLDAIANAVGGWLMIVVHIFTIVAVINTTPSSYHLVRTQLGPFFGRPKFWGTFGPMIGCTGAFIIEYVSSLSLISYWSQIVSCVMSPVVGVSLAEFWICRRGVCPEDEKLPNFRKLPLISLAVSFVFAVICTFFIPSVPTAFGAALFGFVLHTIIGMAGKKTKAATTAA